MNIVITGISRGIGRALALHLHALGHTVSGCARSFPGVQRVGEQTGAPERFHVVDLTDDMQVQSWAEEVLTRSGPPDLLINNAGIIHRAAPLWRVFPDEFDLIVDVNLRGPVHMIRHFVPAMIESGHGVIVNTSSGWGRRAAANQGPYCATKFAIEGLTAALALDLPPGLAAVILDPGIVDTEMSRAAHGRSVGVSPEAWAAQAAPALLALGPKDNGERLLIRAE